MPEITAPAGTSTFNGIAFDWEGPRHPVRQVVDGVTRLVGAIIFYNPTDMRAMEALRRPIAVTPPGDGLTDVYIRYWGADPAKTLITPGARNLLTDGGWVQRKTCSAILYEFQAAPDIGGVHRAQAAFALTTAESNYP